MRILCIALGVLGSLTAHAESPVWAIRGEHNTVYLAGSVHLLRSDDAGLPAAFEHAYADAEALVMEVDVDDPDPRAEQAWMREHGMIAGGTTLRETIGEDRHRAVAAAAVRLGLPIESLQMLEPWALALALGQRQLVQLGFDPEHGVEKQLERRAVADRKEITGLETTREQLGLLDALSYEDQSRFLELTVAEIEDTEEQTEELLRAWRAGDLEGLAALLSEEYRRFPTLYRALVTDRNARWMPQLERLLRDDQDYLVVVGMLHLVGRDGLLQLARRRGLHPAPLR